MSAMDSAACPEPPPGAYALHIYPQLSAESASCCRVVATKDAAAAEVIQQAVASLRLDPSGQYALVEVKESGGEQWVLDGSDAPVHRVLLWPRRAQDEHPQQDGYYFLLQERNRDGSIRYLPAPLAASAGEEEAAAARRLVERGFLPWQQEDFSDLCSLPNLTESSLLENLKRRFQKQKIYTYVGSILIALNPFNFLPIYNPKYVQMYENHPLGRLEPHIFAVADVAYHAMLKQRLNQCIVISGESGSGKTQSTHFLIHCLTALSQKGYASGVERTILGAGPVLEAFGNAKTAHNNNSSRFGKFIQVNYLENGIVRGAVVEKYLLEKSRLVSREKNERNYHVFYYLLLGVSEEERQEFHLGQPRDYFYLNQHNLKIEDGEDLKHDFERLKQAMEMVGFLPATKKQIFSILSAILYLGNVTYKKKAAGRDEGLEVGPPEVLDILSQLLKVKREILVEVLTKRKTVTVNDKLILPYSLSEALTARDSMAKSLYSALFDWIVLRINHALLNKKDMEESVTCLSIGVLDIFGFEDFQTNSFEQFCINYANEQLQYYFNQHIFKLEQEEYRSEGIPWHHIDYTDNVACIHLISKKPTGLFHLLDEESNFPHATSQTLLAKFKQQHEENKFFIGTPVMEPAFIIQHFAGKVKYQIKDFREKNMDYMRPDIVALLRGSDSAYVRELIGMDPVAVFRWATLRAAIRAMAVFAEAGRQRARKTAGVVRQGPRTPLGELQQANTPLEKAYRCAVLDFSFDCSEDFDINAFEDIIASYESKKRSRGARQKQLIPKNLLDSKSLKLIVSMTLHDRTTKSLLHLHKKKKPPSISAQFQTSLNKLLETLGKAEPFFIRCIRSNAEKRELLFDEALVLQQLRYTGMLETVRIRQSGYSAKFPFQDFVDQFQVLLPKNAQACPEEISALLTRLQLDPNSYQIGKTKVFMKEAARQVLQDTLHQEVIRKIIVLQSWLRMAAERRHFLHMRQAAITLQACWRSCRVQRALMRESAATYIQAAWRRYRAWRSYRQQRKRICLLQALVRGFLQRKRFRLMLLEKKLEAARQQQQQQAAVGHENGLSPAEELASHQVARGAEGQPEQGAGPEEEEASAGTGGESVGQPALPPSQKSLASSREKRETRRQRGLQHNALQNKHVAFVLEGQAGAPSREGSPRRPEEEEQQQESCAPVRGVEKSPAPPLGSPGVGVRGLPGEGPLPPDGSAPPPAPQQEVAGPGRLEGTRVRTSQSFTCPERPLELALGLPNHLTSSRSFRSPGSKSQRGSPKELGSPTAFPIQRYQDDPERLRDKRERWKGKRQLARGQDDPLSQSLEEGPGGGPAARSPSPLLRKKGAASSLDDLYRLARPTSAGQSPDTTEGDGSSTTQVLPRGAGEPPAAFLDAAPPVPVPGQQMDAKSSFRSPLRRLLGKRPEKKSLKENADATEEAEPSPFLACVLPMEAEAPSGPPTLPPAEESRAKEPGKAKRNRTIKISKAKTAPEKWRAPFLREIANANELKYLDEFLLNKINDLQSQKSAIECLFFEATEKFRGNIKTMYSSPNGQIHVGYRDLMENYQLLVVNLAKQREEKDVKLVLNLFQALLDEFSRGYAKKEDSEHPKPGKAQKKKRKQERVIEELNGHVFVSYQVNILQSCEQCCSYVWPMEKACLCRICKLTCHKRCLSRVQTGCTSSAARKGDQDPEPRHFGLPVSALTGEKNSVPLVMEKLLEYVEMHGLYTEGIYRKSGSANRMRELKQSLQADPNAARLENYPVHTITGIFKQWLRELPDPLMTFAQYHDFLRAVELPGKQEQLCAIYSVLEQLPRAHHDTLERLIFHLVKVALLEEVNRMSPNALAIVFAPCLLRCPDTSDPLTSMKDVSKTTTCVEMIIKEQMRRYKLKMEEICQLEAAESLAFRQLSLLRQNSLWPVKLGFSSPREGARTTSAPGPSEKGPPAPPLCFLPEEEPLAASSREKELLMEHIQSIQEEKEDITYRLPELDQRGSDEENLDSETSASTESLLEARGRRPDPEGSSEPPSAQEESGPPSSLPPPLPAVAPQCGPSSALLLLQGRELPPAPQPAGGCPARLTS
ncbi:unconventional myosin-IXb isoform X2 [Hemicordylus capensis]|uniref:unconventional myosin-IXb isoform X2 n=1 Tax=Hemicordylus capensis TaxID=884348 RepID=UPI002303B35A|nr:unconventional myosin-IXb isoform X2 [Hemicordylus capensis]